MNVIIRDKLTDLQKRAKANGYARTLLMGGLGISMSLFPERRVLRFGRRVPAWPSTDEISLCHRNGLPIDDGYESARYTLDGYNVIEYAWRIAPAPSPVPAVQPPLALEIAPIKPLRRRKDASIEECFQAFHQLNPHVYDIMRRMAFDLKNAGLTEFGVKMLYENMRYSYAIQTKGGRFKLDNRFTSRYARMLDAIPELHGCIELRELRA